MKSIVFIILAFISTIQVIIAQESLHELLARYNTKNIPYITAQELAMPKTDAIILDTRENNEYSISHVKDAFFVGFNNFSINSVLSKFSNKNEKIVVYCSIGIRSESIAVKLKKAGYKNVFNLYGGIFEWKNNNFPVYDSGEKETENVSAFSKAWSKWLIKGNKVY